MTPEQAATELLLRRKARTSLAEFAKYIDIPGVPVSDDEEEVLLPIEEKMAIHHIMICDVMQGLIENTLEYNGEKVRGAMLFLPPGAAKSTYGTTVAPAWAVGKYEKYNIITTSYGTPLALKHSRRTRQILKSQKYQNVFGLSLAQDNSAVEDYTLDNESGVRAAGILAGITGNRADGIVIDDPIKGREEADSETIRQKTKDAIDDDLMTRLKPNAWVCYILTRWHEDDPAGKLLPENWNGETGFFRCSDGQVYYVLSIPARCDRQPDPLDREIGEYIWPEWFPANHWDRFQHNPRTWSALYQQRPQPEEGSYFLKEWFKEYRDLPEHLNYWITSDFAVSEDKGDFTEHTVWATDKDDNLYFIHNWHKQCTPDVWIDELLYLIKQFEPICSFGEGGVIRRSVEPFLRKRMQEKQTYCRMEWINPVNDKTARARGFQSRASMGKIFFPKNEISDRCIDQMIRFPTGKHDDFVDTASLMGLVIDGAHAAYVPPEPEEPQFLQELTFNDIMKQMRRQRDSSEW